MPTPQAVSDHYRAQQRLIVATLALTQAAWSRMGDDFDASWRSVAPVVTAVAMRGQLAAATAGAGYVGPALDEIGADVDPDGEVVPRAFAGVASDGRPLPSLLDGAVVRAKEAVGSGLLPAEALVAGGKWLQMAVHTQVADAARGAAGVAIAVRPGVGYVRMLNPPSCSRCSILAGKRFLRNPGFQRHPRCFPAGTVVSGPLADGATRRWYEGELVVIRTAGGKNLSVTGNHPVLTSQGWLPANLIREGGDVVGRASGDRSGALLVPDHDQMPARIEDLWSADGMAALGRVPVAAEDFHGDGVGSGHVDVVLADRLLGARKQVAGFQEFREQALPLGAILPIALTHASAGDEFGLGGAAPTDCTVCGVSLASALAPAHVGGADQASLAGTPDGHIGAQESAADHVSADLQPSGDGVLALAGPVGRGERFHVETQVATRWDAPADSFSMQSRSAYAALGHDLLLRLAGHVELDRVVEVRRVQWSGHVFNLTSREGWYDAEGIIVSNCDCRHIPCTEDVADDLRTDPKAYFDSLSESEQSRIFTKSGAKAIRDGADMGRVVNARRGMSSSYKRLDRIYATDRPHDQVVRALRNAGFIR